MLGQYETFHTLIAFAIISRYLTFKVGHSCDLHMPTSRAITYYVFAVFERRLPTIHLFELKFYRLMKKKYQFKLNVRTTVKFKTIVYVKISNNFSCHCGSARQRCKGRVSFLCEKPYFGPLPK